MIRLNVFFEIKEGVTVEQVKALTDKLIDKSRQDKGNKGYDLYVSTTQPATFMFCETWENEEFLSKHTQEEHFTLIVPQLEKLTQSGLKLEQFDK